MILLDDGEGIISTETLNTVRSQVLGDIIKDMVPVYDSDHELIIGIKFIFEDEFKYTKEWLFGCLEEDPTE
jgi:hypothetical protein